MNINLGSLNWLDIIFGLVLLSFMFTAMKRGLVQTLFGMCSFFISIIISRQLYPKVALIIKSKTRIYGMFDSMLKNTLDLSKLNIDMSGFVAKQGENIASDMGNNVVEGLKNSTGLSKELLNKIQLPSFIKDKFLSSSNFQLNISKFVDLNAIRNYITNNLSDVLINILAMVITFSIVSLVLGIVSHVLNVISFLPVIGQFNRIGGLGVGFLQGIISLWVACTIVSLFIEYPACSVLKKALGSSAFAIKIYDSNLLLKFLAKYIPVLR